METWPIMVSTLPDRVFTDSSPEFCATMNRFTISKNPWLRWALITLDGFFPSAYSMLRDLRFFPKGLATFVVEYFRYKRLAVVDPEYPVRFLDMFPRPYERYRQAGEMPRHYFQQDLWAARKVYASKVSNHYDIGSRLDGFIAHCLSFCRVTMIDLRPLSHNIADLAFIRADATDLREIPSGSIESISSLHAVDDFGVGHYGPHLDPLAYRKAIDEIQRVAAPGANIYFSVPICGAPRVMFNAGRIFDPGAIERYFKDCRLVDWAALDDDDVFSERPNLENYRRAQHGCGMYHFQKL